MISITQTYLRHSGGTKFYRAMLIARCAASGDFTNAVSVVHYGPVSSGGSGEEGRPVRGGQTRLYNGNTEYYRKLEAKTTPSATGDVYERVSDKTNNYEDPRGRGELVMLFGAKTAQEICVALGLPADGSGGGPTTEPETTVSAPRSFASKPAHWGTW